MKTMIKVLILITLLVPAAALMAQTSYEVKSGTVVAVFNDQLVVKLADGTTKQFTVPAGFQFTVDGQQVGIADLKPGTELSATIKTTTKPSTVTTTKIRNGEVIRTSGNTMWVREDGKIRTISVPKGFKFQMDGRDVTVDQLRAGDRLTAEIVTTSESSSTTRDIDVAGSAPAPPPAPAEAPAAAPMSEPEPAAAPALPATGSKLPLAALLGTLLVAIGVAIRR